MWLPGPLFSSPRAEMTLSFWAPSCAKRMEGAEEEECRVASQTVYGRTNFGTWKIWSPGRTYWGGACNIGSGHLSINGNPGDDPDSYSKCQGNANCLCRCRAAGSDPREAQRDARAEAEQKRPGIKAAKEAKKADRKAERQADRQARRHAGAADRKSVV